MCIRDSLDPVWDATVELVAARDGWRLDDSGPAADLATQLAAALTTGATFDAPYWMEAPLWQAVCPTLILSLIHILGCLFAIDSDAHAPGQLDMKAYGCERATRLGIPAERIVTTWPVDQLLEWAGRGR